MEAAIAISYPLVEKSPTPLLIGWIRDQAEHYGKFVSNYRAVGIVPPISRKPASQLAVVTSVDRWLACANSFPSGRTGSERDQSAVSASARRPRRVAAARKVAPKPLVGCSGWLAS